MKGLVGDFALASDRPDGWSRWAGAALRMRSVSLLLVELHLRTGEGFGAQNIDLLEAVCSMVQGIGLPAII